jgi:hypothetical protein
MGILYNLFGRAWNDLHFFVLEQRVRDCGDFSLLQEWPPDEDSLSDHFLCNLLRFLILTRVLDMDDHRFVPTFGSVDINPVTPERCVVMHCLEGRETGQRFSAKEDAIA